MQAIDPHPNLTLFFSIWAAIGPLCGLVAGHILTRSWQRRQWILECRKAEFREVITALSDAVVHLMMFTPAYEVGPAEKQWNEFETCLKIAMRTLADRIYIARDLRELDTTDRFLQATQGARQSDIGERSEILAAVIGELVLRANKG
jgi:hypothetical protein